MTCDVIAAEAAVPGGMQRGQARNESKRAEQRRSQEKQQKGSQTREELSVTYEAGGRRLLTGLRSEVHNVE